MKPFDTNLAKAGHPVQTRDGKPVRIVCWDRKFAKYPLIALIQQENGSELYGVYTEDGKGVSSPSESDLFMASQKHEGWTNIYSTAFSGDTTGIIYDTEEDAKKNASGGGYIATAHIEWEE